MKKRLLLTLLICLLGLSSCNVNSSSNSESVSTNSSVISNTTTSNTTTSNITTSNTTSGTDKYEEKYYEIPSNIEERQFKISIQGALIDYNVHKKIITGSEDEFQFEYTDIYTPTSICTSSNTEVLKVEKINEFRYRVIALHEGNTVLRIKDTNGIDRYTIIIYVRDPMTRNEIEDYLSEVDYWISYSGLGDNYKLTFLFDNQVGISGALQNVPFESYTATYELKEETFDEFRFVFTDEKTSKHEAQLVSFNVSKAGDFLYLMYKNGIAGILTPVMESQD